MRRIELTDDEAATLAGVSPITVRGWVCRGRIRRNAHGRIDGAALLAYLDKRGDHGQHTGRRLDRRSDP